MYRTLICNGKYFCIIDGPVRLFLNQIKVAFILLLFSGGIYCVFSLYCCRAFISRVKT